MTNQKIVYHSTDSRLLSPLPAFDSPFYGQECPTQNIFCRNWMELNANFGLQGEASIFNVCLKAFKGID